MSARDDPHLDVDPAAATATAGTAPQDARAGEPPASPLSAGDAALVARVVAWHNRHPLARRLRPAEVGGLGHLSLPCELPPARAEGGWRRWVPTRLLWRWRLKPAFDDHPLIPGLSARRIAAFAHRHAGVERAGGDPGWPERVVPVRAGAQNAVARHLMTVAIKRGAGESQRILIGPGPAQPVLGRRQWSRPRWLAAGLVACLLLGAVLGAAWWWRGRPAGAGVAGAAATASSAPAPAPFPRAASASAPHAVAHDDVLQTAAAASAAPAFTAPASTAVSGEADKDSLTPAEPASAAVHPAGPTAMPQAAEAHAADPQRAPSHAVETPGATTAATVASAARPSAAASAMGAASAATRDSPAEPARPIPSIRPARPVLKPPAPVRSHALVTAPTWNRAETEGRRTRLVRLLGGQLNGLQLEVLRLPEGEVLALWPLPTQADAEVLARRLKPSGITMLAVDF